MWSETVGLTARPVSDQKIGRGLGLDLGLGLVSSGLVLGLVSLVVVLDLRIWSCLHH